MEYQERSIHDNGKGYPAISIDGKERTVHKLVWEKENGYVPTGYQIHHKDFDKWNYDILNLEILTQSDHQRVHAGWIKKNREWHSKPCRICDDVLPLGDFYQRRTANTPAAVCKKCSWTEQKNRLQSPEQLEKKRKYQREWQRRKAKKL